MAHESDGPQKGEVTFKNGRAYYDGDPTDDEDEDNDTDDE